MTPLLLTSPMTGIQEFTGQAQKRPVAEAMIFCGAAAIMMSNMGAVPPPPEQMVTDLKRDREMSDYQAKIIRIDVSNREVKVEEVDNPIEMLGGRAFISHWLTNHIDSECDPLGKKNSLVIAPGLLAGAPSSSVHRLSVGAKSPLTNGIKESNSGGNVAYKLARLGIKAMILEGEPVEDEWLVLRVGGQGVEFEPADELLGTGSQEAAEIIHSRYGPQVALMVIGPGGEFHYPTAAIINSDRQGFAARICGRGGLGAVMASKGVKAIVIDDQNTRARPLADKERFKAASKEYLRLLRETPQTSEIYTKYGTAAMTDITNELGGLPTLNFKLGRFEGAEKINGRTLYKTITERGGDPSHACMPGCIICSSNIYVDQEGKPIVRSLEYETLIMFGSNCDIDDLDELARINGLCNDIGLDTIDLGAAMGIAMEAGVIPFGDAQGVKRLLEEVREGTILGRVLGQGAAITGRVLGVKRIPAVKGQAMAAYDPRAIKGHGVTFSTSTMGADHTAGFTIREGLDSHDKSGQVQASARMQVNGMLYDSLGVCLLAHVAVRDHHELLAEMVCGLMGREKSQDELRQMAIQAINKERDFNRGAGLGQAADRLPEIFCQEVNPSSNTVFDLEPGDLDGLEYE